MTSKIISPEKYLDFKDVLIRPRPSTINSRSLVDLIRTFEFKNNVSWTGVPVIAANMTSVGTLRVYNTLCKHQILTGLHKFVSLDDLNQYNQEHPEEPLDSDYFAISTGISDNDYENFTNIMDNFACKFIIIDIANGYIEGFKTYCKKVRQRYPDKIIIAGNVATKEGVQDLIDCGIDIVKVGIGGGSACTTRIQTGIGMPQFSCVLEATQSREDKTYIISDGGITCPGDMAKAFGGGADFVMVGGVFAGHDENPGKLIDEDGKKFKFFYGMSSSFAMKNNYAANNNTAYRSSEGREIKIKYKGRLDDTVQNYLGGVRSTCTYTNSRCIKELSDNCEFMLVNNQFNSNLLG
jgi:GMP reductase